MPVEKVSVSVDSDVLAAARPLAERRGGLSALVTDALARQVKLERMRVLLANDAAEFGDVDDDLLRAVRAAWPG